MSAKVPIYCPLCHTHVCDADTLGVKRVFFGCEHCEVIFQISGRVKGLSTALHELAKACEEH